MLLVFAALLVSGVGVPVIEMVGRVSPWFGIVALGPSISVTSIVNRGVVSLESVRVGPVH